MNKVLIVVDMQIDFIYGALGTPEARNIVSNVVHKVTEARINSDTVIYTKDIHYDNYDEYLESKYVPPHCIHGDAGSEIIPELLNLQDWIAFKSTYAYTFWSNWIGIFEDAEAIELCGVCTDICVISNALVLRSLYPATPIIVDASCCAGLTPEKHRAALEVMKSCNIEVINE